MPDLTSFEAPIAKRIRGLQAKEWLANLNEATSSHITSVVDLNRITLMSSNTKAWLLSVDWDEEGITITEPGSLAGYKFRGNQNAFVFLNAVVEAYVV